MGDREVPRAGWSTNAAEADLARRLRPCRYTAARGGDETYADLLARKWREVARVA